MTNTSKGSGIFGCPGGQVTVETPDGVTKTMGDGTVHNSLTNSCSAYGGPDGSGWGAFEDSCRGFIVVGSGSPAKPKFRVD